MRNWNFTVENVNKLIAKKISTSKKTNKLFYDLNVEKYVFRGLQKTYHIINIDFAAKMNVLLFRHDFTVEFFEIYVPRMNMNFLFLCLTELLFNRTQRLTEWKWESTQRCTCCMGFAGWRMGNFQHKFQRFSDMSHD